MPKLKALIPVIRKRQMRRAWHLANFIGAPEDVIEILRTAADSFEDCGPQRGAVFAFLDQLCERAAAALKAAHDRELEAKNPQPLG